MENPNSEGVVLPDISEAEHLASEHDGGENGEAVVDDKNRVTIQTVRHGGVPVTLPVGSLITSTFNVITQDQLPHFKPMLCVDNNGYIATDGSGNELKTIVIQEDVSSNTPVAVTAANAGSWSEAASLPVLPVRCSILKRSREHSGDDSDDGHPTKEEAWQNLAEGLDSSEYQLMDSVTNVDPSVALKRLEEIAGAIGRLSSEFKRTVEEVKDVINRQADKYQRDKEAAVLAARVEAQVAALQPESSDNTLQPALDNEHQKKCANCNREALAECSLCRRTPYCSTFCQRKDWGSHQVECVRGVANEGPQQSIMLIVESAEQQ